MEITTWILVLMLYTAKGEPAAITAIPGFASGFECNETGQMFIARGPGKKGFQCLPMGTDGEPKDATK